MNDVMLVVLVALGVAGVQHILYYFLWVLATRGGVFTALGKLIKNMVIFFIAGVFLSAPIWYWLWIYHIQVITYPSVLAGIFLTGTTYSFWSMLTQPGYVLDRLRDSLEEDEMIDRKNELVFFFLLVVIGAAVYFQYFK